MEKIVLAEKFVQFDDHWSPRILGEANGQFLKIAKVKGDFVAHSHKCEDEAFLCVAGRFGIRFPATGDVVELGPGELCIVPAGVEHQPFAEEETQILLFEPKRTAHTGDVETGLTKAIDEQPHI
ncbi:MAG: cupin domain-containing protein [Planctomycetes bacterium]|nr:cupin domain-containing protein [Planctomycetota bacterium]